jgi:serine/threonine protein kinase
MQGLHWSYVPPAARQHGAASRRRPSQGRWRRADQVQEDNRHKEGIVHGDIKIENAILGARGNVKLADSIFASQHPHRRLPAAIGGSLGGR